MSRIDARSSDLAGLGLRWLSLFLARIRLPKKNSKFIKFHVS